MGSRVQIDDFSALPDGFVLTNATLDKVLHFQTDGLPVPFVADDILITQRYNPNGDTVIKDIAIEVDEIDQDELNYTTISGGDNIQPGDVFVRVAAPAGINLMKFNVNGSDTPYIAMMQNLQSLADYTDSSKEIVRLGDLGGITSSVWGELDGPGLYVKNGYFEGVYVSGTFMTALSGQRLELDAENNEMNFYNSADNLVVRIGNNVYPNHPGIAFENGSYLRVKEGALAYIEGTMVISDGTNLATLIGPYFSGIQLRPMSVTDANANAGCITIDSSTGELHWKTTGGTSYKILTTTV